METWTSEAWPLIFYHVSVKLKDTDKSRKLVKLSLKNENNEIASPQPFHVALKNKRVNSYRILTLQKP